MLLIKSASEALLQLTLHKKMRRYSKGKASNAVGATPNIFCFETVKGTVSNQAAASKGSTLPRPPCASDEFGVCPMPSAKRFDAMVDDEKKGQSLNMR